MGRMEFDYESQIVLTRVDSALIRRTLGLAGESLALRLAKIPEPERRGSEAREIAEILDKTEEALRLLSKAEDRITAPIPEKQEEFPFGPVVPLEL